MPRLIDVTPRISVRLYKTISRTTVDGVGAVSTRYKGKSEFIDLTPFLGEGSSVTTTKSVREPAGGWRLTFADRPLKASGNPANWVPTSTIESIYGLIEPMDVVEIRMWSGLGPAPAVLPIKMRGFVSRVQRVQAMSQDGKPVRQVMVSGLDYGKIWQTFQILYLPAYAEGKGMLTNFSMWEMFGVKAESGILASELVKKVVTEIINPHIKGFMPEKSVMPTEIEAGKFISVTPGAVSDSYQNQQGSLYDLLKFYGDVGVWNELYTEDHEDGVHCVYRAIPAMHISKPDGAKDRKIQEAAPDPIMVEVPDHFIRTLNSERADDNVANFYWVNNQRYDLIDDVYRKLHAIGSDDTSVNLKEYPNSAVKYYGVRKMEAETQQTDGRVLNLSSGQDAAEQEKRSGKFVDWLTLRRQQMVDMNKDNVVLERGTASVKGGLMRPDGKECMKAGDYAVFKQGTFSYPAYIVELIDEFQPFAGYTATINYERGEGFVRRIQREGGLQSPWLAEQSSRRL